ncbi:MAG TPA: CHAD domain-containing protein [Nocardioides sp.]|uniref:CHAD domain-containing protein n=1 Tax=Nocardioides sp. TaxID=35761 RepID=UPI002E328C7C|nr:CHAD domain-containing protein [Nocardioides sp.]HEX5088428.1 CHAD domain-containing protein [Nocardioides sp.]
MVDAPDVPEPQRPSRTKPARRLLHLWVIEQAGEIERLDPLVRELDPSGVHGMRKACRRLRGGLATCRPLVDRDRTDPIREELRWLARTLGPARDDEVVGTRIEQLLGAEEADTGLAHRALARHVHARADHNRAVLGEALGSQRYADLRTSLDRLGADPPWTAQADRPARDVLPELVRQEGKRMRRRRREAEDPHEVRKAAKRLRYAYELVEPVWRAEAKGPREAAGRLTSVLGERQDTVVARDWLVTLSAGVRSGRAGFVLGRIHAQEQQRELELLDEADSVWQELKALSW